MTALAIAIIDAGVYLAEHRSPRSKRDRWEVIDRDGTLIARDNERGRAIEKAVKTLAKMPQPSPNTPP